MAIVILKQLNHTYFLLCFLATKFDAYGDSNINISSYVKFLGGDLWDDRFLKIEYDNVTVSFSDNLISATYFSYTTRITHVISEDSVTSSNWDPDHYVSFRGSERKCFTVDAPFVDNDLLWAYDIKVKNDIFPDGKRSEHTSIILDRDLLDTIP